MQSRKKITCAIEHFLFFLFRNFKLRFPFKMVDLEEACFDMRENMKFSVTTYFFIHQKKKEKKKKRNADDILFK